MLHRGMNEILLCAIQVKATKENFPRFLYFLADNRVFVNIPVGMYEALKMNVQTNTTPCPKISKTSKHSYFSNRSFFSNRDLLGVNETESSHGACSTWNGDLKQDTKGQRSVPVANAVRLQ